MRDEKNEWDKWNETDESDGGDVRDKLDEKMRGDERNKKDERNEKIGRRIERCSYVTILIAINVTSIVVLLMHLVILGGLVLVYRHSHYLHRLSRHLC